MSAERRWIKFWPQDWQREPALRMCSMAARGLWMEMMCLAHEGRPYGHVTVNGNAPTHKQLASITGAAVKEVVGWIEELEAAGVFNRTAEGVIWSRRMVRDKAYQEQQAGFGRGGGNPTLKTSKADTLNDTLKGVDKAPLRQTHKFLEAEAEAEARSKKQEKETTLRVVVPRRGTEDADFDRFWAVYPRKDGKLDALKAWKGARKLASAEEIIAGVERYPFEAETRLQKLPAGWLREGRWMRGLDTRPVTIATTATNEMKNDWNQF